MNIYLDDNHTDRRLAGLLAKANHRVLRPADVRLSGARDPLHLEHAIRAGLALLTADRKDYIDLDRLIQTSGADTAASSSSDTTTTRSTT